MLRQSSSTRSIDDLTVERCYGDVFDDAALRAAMVDCDDVYYCVVDARMWLRDPAPLFRTNVEGLRHVLDAAVEANLHKFIFTSTIGTLAISDSRLVTEDDPHNWTEGGAYIEARVAAEKLVLEYARDKGLPAVALCISTTYGPRDWQPTPHGSALAMVAAGKMPFNLSQSLEVVGIEDAARAMLLAAEHGKPGERYIISDSYLSSREVNEIAARAVGARVPRISIPESMILAGGRINDLAARMLGKDLMMAYAGMKMAQLMSPLDHSKAERELGWKPEPVADSIAKAARFFQETAGAR
jgi:dihydroflavonol-4-reductase